MTFHSWSDRAYRMIKTPFGALNHEPAFWFNPNDPCRSFAPKRTSGGGKSDFSIGP